MSELFNVLDLVRYTTLNYKFLDLYLKVDSMNEYVRKLQLKWARFKRNVKKYKNRLIFHLQLRMLKLEQKLLSYLERKIKNK